MDIVKGRKEGRDLLEIYYREYFNINFPSYDVISR